MNRDVPVSFHATNRRMPVGRLLDENHASEAADIRIGTIEFDGSRVCMDAAVLVNLPQSTGECPHDAQILLKQIEHDLFAPFVGADEVSLEMHYASVTTASLDSPAREVASKLVKYGYGSRYLAGPADAIHQLDLDKDELERAGRCLVLVAEGHHAGRDQVLGTLRIILGPSLPLRTFFRMDNGIPWPHERRPASVAGEFSRLAFHPVIDLIAHAGPAPSRELVRLYKRIIARQLWDAALAHLRERDVSTAYFVASPTVSRFFEASGILCSRVPEALPSRSQQAIRVRRPFPGYWQPGHRSLQPALYIADWSLGDVECVLGPQTVLLTGADRALIAFQDTDNEPPQSGLCAVGPAARTHGTARGTNATAA